MKTRHFIKALNNTVYFVDLFGDNLGGDKLTAVIVLTGEKGKISIQNKFGTVKTFDKEHIFLICDEIANCLESFKPNYPGYVKVHTSQQGSRINIQLSSRIYLNGTKCTRDKIGTITISGKEISIRFEVTETFTEQIS